MKSRRPRLDDGWPDFPVILGSGSLHDLRDIDTAPRSRLWNLKSTSKAACIAADATPPATTRQVGFVWCNAEPRRGVSKTRRPGGPG